MTVPAGLFVTRLLTEINGTEGGLPAAAAEMGVETWVIHAITQAEPVSPHELNSAYVWLASRVRLLPEEESDFRRLQATARADRQTRALAVPSPRPLTGGGRGPNDRRGGWTGKELALCGTVVVLVIALSVVITVMLTHSKTAASSGTGRDRTTEPAAPPASTASSSSADGSATPSPTVTELTASPSPSSGVPGIYHQGPLFLTGDDVDLDAPASDPQWGALNLTPGNAYDIHGYGNTAIFTDGNAEAVQLGPQTGNSCFTATGYSGDRVGIDTPPIRIGQQICIRTTEGRFSLLKVISLPSDGIQLTVTTYASSPG